MQTRNFANNDSPSLESVLSSRYSCRGYLATPVPANVLRKILQLAQRTPSWCNCQPWQVIITAGDATENFRQAYLEQTSAPPEQPDFPWPMEYKGLQLERRRECGYGLYNSLGIEKSNTSARRRQEMENFRFFGAPHTAIVTVDEALGVYGTIDCGGYVNTFMMAAQANGVASIAQASLAARPDFIRAHFGLPASQRIVCGISFGYADEEHPANHFRTSRADLGENIQLIGNHDEFKHPTSLQHIALC